MAKVEGKNGCAQTASMALGDAETLQFYDANGSPILKCAGPKDCRVTFRHSFRI